MKYTDMKYIDIAILLMNSYLLLFWYVEPRRYSHVLPAQAAQILQQQGRKSKPIAQHLGISHI